MPKITPEAFAGSHLEGTIVVAASALRDLLRAAPAPLRDAGFELAADNQVVVRYGMFHATAVLGREIEPGPAPRLMLRLASWTIALAMKAAVRQPWLFVHGRDVSIDLSAVPGLAPMRPYWPAVRSVSLATSPDAVRLKVVLRHEDTHA